MSFTHSTLLFVLGACDFNKILIISNISNRATQLNFCIDPSVDVLRRCNRVIVHQLWLRVAILVIPWQILKKFSISEIPAFMGAEVMICYANQWWWILIISILSQIPFAFQTPFSAVAPKQIIFKESPVTTALYPLSQAMLAAALIVRSNVPTNDAWSNVGSLTQYSIITILKYIEGLTI